jgi:NAD(P)-dependent dehydrogenase (short-subunit alcohol dehydrogenase family)
MANASPTVSFALPECVVVSGASSGFGAMLVQRLLDAGALVVGVDVAPPPILEAADGRYSHVVGSVTDEPTWIEAREAALASSPHSLGLVTCAAILHVGTATDHDVEAWRRVIDVNVTGTLLALRSMVPAIADLGGGPIVAMGSVDARFAEQQLASYCASKAAVYQLARTTALDFGRAGVRVNVLSPGPMQVGLFERHLETVDDPHLLETRTRRQPNGRILDPEEVVRAALFMLSDGATGMTGAEMMVDGGLTTGYEFRLD